METPQGEEKKSPFRRVKEFISTSLNSKTVGLLALLLLFAAIPLTVYVSQQQQETRQRAQESTFRQQTQPKPTKKIDEEKDSCKGKTGKPGGCECKKDNECASKECKRAEGQKEGKCTGPTPTPSPTPSADCKKSTDRPNGCPCENNNQCNSKVCDEPPDKGDSDEDEEKKDEEEKDDKSGTGSGKKKDKVCIGPTLTVSPTPPSTGSAKLAIKLSLQGIGSDGNPSPLRPKRDIMVTFVGEQNNQVEKQGQMIFDSASGSYIATVDMGTVPSGVYSVKTQTKGYLRKLVAKILTIQSGTPNYVIPGTSILVPGDINGDNKIDITDYNSLISCFSEKADTPECGLNKELSDFNDDGTIDGVDYNLFLRALAVREGD